MENLGILNELFTDENHRDIRKIIFKNLIKYDEKLKNIKKNIIKELKQQKIKIKGDNLYNNFLKLKIFMKN